MSEEYLPDMPNILIALEETLQELEEEDDLSKINKAQLARNQSIIIDAMMDMCKYMVAKAYKIDILDKAIERKFSTEEDGEPEAEIFTTDLPQVDNMFT